MPKIKLTKNELKTQRDALKRYQRFLPTLQLKKQQLQMEVRLAREAITQVTTGLATQRQEWSHSVSLLSGTDAPTCSDLLEIQSWTVSRRNVAGVDVPVFESLNCRNIPQDLFLTPPWYDSLAETARTLLELELRASVLQEMEDALEQELRIVSQRVNLFEKVKIPEAKEAIRKINISLGDQQTNSVGRSKIAKGKCAQRDAATLLSFNATAEESPQL